jgi:hypothetical protein
LRAAATRTRGQFGPEAFGGYPETPYRKLADEEKKIEKPSVAGLNVGFVNWSSHGEFCGDEKPRCMADNRDGLAGLDAY